jgi:hypothetical protein
MLHIPKPPRAQAPSKPRAPTSTQADDAWAIPTFLCRREGAEGVVAS